MADRVALVTGAGGEMGRLLIPALGRRGFDVVALDLFPLSDEIADQCIEVVTADVCDPDIAWGLLGRHKPAAIFHLAAILSARAELDANLAHHVNVDGTLQLMRLSGALAQAGLRPRFLLPSSIAVYGLPDVETKRREGALAEHQRTAPSGVYGANKLYCELMGKMFSRDRGPVSAMIDFRSIRFPGLLSADSVPTSGTTDFAPAMVHAAARGEAYDCFVAPETQLPFMTMPDAVTALIQLAEAEEASVTQRTYNIQGFSASAGELRDAVLKVFPDATIGYKVDPARQGLADSWPAALDDSAARREWGLAPEHDLDGSIAEYLAPRLRERYGASAGN